jgi:hypothetical protein
VGAAHVTAKISNLAKKETAFEGEFLVDTGSIDCMAPAEKLQAAGIQPEGRAVYELANGKPIECNYGFAPCPSWATKRLPK